MINSAIHQYGLSTSFRKLGMKNWQKFLRQELQLFLRRCQLHFLALQVILLSRLMQLHWPLKKLQKRMLQKRRKTQKQKHFQIVETRKNLLIQFDLVRKEKLQNQLIMSLHLPVKFTVILLWLAALLIGLRLWAKHQLRTLLNLHKSLVKELYGN